MSEHAFRSRRVMTAAADFKRGMREPVSLGIGVDASCERRQIARRRAEEERAEAFFPLRATTKSADSKRDCASSKPRQTLWRKTPVTTGALYSLVGQQEF